VPGRTAESLSVLQEALTQAEQLLGLAGEDEAAQIRRGRVEIRLDSGWGSEAMITWLLSRGYQVTGKFKSSSRVRKLVEAHHRVAAHLQSGARGRPGAHTRLVRSPFG
jgi:hypothetical protein